jgi:hypothetical protein
MFLKLAFHRVASRIVKISPAAEIIKLTLES